MNITDTEKILKFSSLNILREQHIYLYSLIFFKEFQEVFPEEFNPLDIYYSVV